MPNQEYFSAGNTKYRDVSYCVNALTIEPESLTLIPPARKKIHLRRPSSALHPPPKAPASAPERSKNQKIPPLQAPEDANGGTEDANGGTEDANGGTKDANGGTKDANGGTKDANGATEDANGETDDPNGEPEDANGETEDANGGTENANGATEDGTRDACSVERRRLVAIEGGLLGDDSSPLLIRALAL